MSTRRVVVTGMGIVSPVGNEIDTAWSNIREGRSGIRRIEEIDPTEFPTQSGGEVRDFDIGDYISPRDARRMDTFMHYGIAASVDAVRDSGLAVTEEYSHRIGVAMGAGIGGLATIEDNHDKYLASGARKISPFFIPGSIINMTSGNVSIMYGMTGPNLSIVTACATSTHSIGIAARRVIHGDGRIVLRVHRNIHVRRGKSSVSIADFITKAIGAMEIRGRRVVERAISVGSHRSTLNRSAVETGDG